MASNPKDLSKKSLDINSDLKLFKIYKNLKNVSLKSDTYFQVYQDMFGEFEGKDIVFVEIGVLHGGSLFMWREYFGKNSRIIGIDLNPEAKKLEKDGFEIFIGSQSDPTFWKNFYNEVGDIDILLDDGGHENAQQIITIDESINNIKENGIIAVEDTHTSYLKKFGNPSKYSFINYSKHLVDLVNSRFPEVLINSKNQFKNKIYSVSFYESIVAIKVNEKKSIESTLLKNNDNEINTVLDYRTTDYFPSISNFINRKLPSLNKIPVIKKIVRYLFFSQNFIVKIRDYLKLKKYFK